VSIAGCGQENRRGRKNPGEGDKGHFQLEPLTSKTRGHLPKEELGRGSTGARTPGTQHSKSPDAGRCKVKQKVLSINQCSEALLAPEGRGGHFKILGTKKMAKKTQGQAKRGRGGGARWVVSEHGLKSNQGISCEGGGVKSHEGTKKPSGSDIGHVGKEKAGTGLVYLREWFGYRREPAGEASETSPKLGGGRSSDT